MIPSRETLPINGGDLRPTHIEVRRNPKTLIIGFPGAILIDYCELDEYDNVVLLSNYPSPNSPNEEQECLDATTWK